MDKIVEILKEHKSLTILTLILISVLLILGKDEETRKEIKNIVKEKSKDLDKKANTFLKTKVVGWIETLN